MLLFIILRQQANPSILMCEILPYVDFVQNMIKKCVFPLTLFLLLIFCLFTGKQLSQFSDLDSADLIPKQCEIGVIFEYQNDLPDSFKINDGNSLARYFNSLRLEKADSDFDEPWVFRITFSSALGGFGAVSGEYVSIPPDAETLTVLVGDSKMLIGDVSYRLPSPDFLDILEVKYNYFSERLYFDTKHTVLQD